MAEVGLLVENQASRGFWCFWHPSSNKCACRGGAKTVGSPFVGERESMCWVQLYNEI